MNIEEEVRRVNGELRTLIADVKGRSDRYDELAAAVVKMQGPGADFGSLSHGRTSPEQKAYGEFLRRGINALGPEERKVLTVSDDPQAGYLAPPQVAAEIIKGVNAYSPLRSICKVLTCNRESLEIPKKTASGTATWVSETGTRAEVTGLTYGMERFSPDEMTYLAKTSLKLLEDNAYNLEGELNEEFALAFAALEGLAFISGDAAGKPEGILTNASIPHITSAASGVIDADVVMKLPYEVKTDYAKNGTYVMNRKTLGVIRLLKDATSGVYIWQPGFGGQPNLLCGYPVLECSDMPDIAASAYAVVFGDFKRGYVIVDRVQIAIQRLAELYAREGQVGFLARKRVAGQVVLAEAFCKLEIKA